MQWSGTTARRALISAALLFSLHAGCGNVSVEAPSTKTARQALDEALTAWRRGEKPGELSGTEPPVVVRDTPWGQGQRLASYEILEEDEGAVAEKQFTVRLSLAEPERTEEVRYHVLGTDPLMIFRDEDYYRNINMENGPRLPRLPN
ncbi:MAG TPA: hypothetical protein VFT74_20260 [Isosphaeraceae bacterium]|nr:hypothetical protein [Isosphaeraceae bacterium]